jgi:protein-disulfide isomerase
MTDDASPPPPAPARAPWLSGRALGVAAIALSAVALAAVLLPNPAFDGQVRRYLLAHPEVLDEMVQARQAAEQRAHAEAVNQMVAANPSLLGVSAADPAFGPTNAKVTVIEFFDFRCPGCKAVAPEVLKMVRDNPDVRFVFKDWPILDRPNDQTSTYAARAALAAHRQGKYLAVYEGLMREPSLDPAGVDRVLATAGVDMVRAKAELGGAEVSRQLADTHATAATLRLQGTPTFFVNGRASEGIAPAEIRRMIAAAR